MKVEIKKIELSGSKEWSERRQNLWSNQQRALIAIGKDGKQIVKAQYVYSKNGTCHALVYVYGDEKWAVGFGRATGYGYCKSSHAVWEAFRDAGIEIDNLAGRGMEREAVDAVAIAIAGDNFLTTVSV
jgi:hypothetical protein